jgi:transcriptional antiterminator RfaH
MNNLHAGWYLIYTKPSHEKKVYARFTDNNIESFLPMRKTLRTWHDRKKYINQPLFPSYVFVYLKDKKDYYNILDTEGVLYYVKSGKEISRVSETVINNLMLLSNQVNELEISEGYFQPSRQMVISTGALTGLSCEIVQYKSKQTLLVRVDLLQRNLLVAIPAESLTAV